MFVYGVCAGPSDKYERIVEPAVARVSPGAQVIVERGRRSIHEAYNAIIDRAAGLADVEALVLMHDDVELLDPDIESKLREVLADSTVGVIGVIGGRGHVEMPWWEGDAKAGRVVDNQQGELDFGRGTQEVDTVDGLLLALSPVALRALRFDERRYGRTFHGYDAEICSQARAAGLKVLVADVEVHHHNNTSAWRGDELSYEITDLTWQLRWRTLTPRSRLETFGRRTRLQVRRWRRDRRR